MFGSSPPHPSTGRAPGRAGPFRRLRHVALAAAVGCACAWPPAGPLGAADAPASHAGLPELVRTKHRSFSIPFKPPTGGQDADAAAQRVVMSVSKDLGVTWEPAGEVAPSVGSFSYQAGADGEYWFRLRAVDRKGRSRGGEGPDMRVLVDAAGPRLAARVWKGVDGEIVCRYAAVDDSIRMESLKVEYRTAADPGWKSIAAQGVLSRESPAHLVGEEIWWAGEKVESLSVRIVVADASGNQSVKQFSMEPTDPNVDQAALARELGALPLPSQPSPAGSAIAADGGPALPSPAVPALPAQRPGEWAAEAASAWSAEQPRAAASTARPGGPQSVLVHKTAADSVGGTPVSRGSMSLAPAGMPGQIAADSSQLEYRGRPLQISRSRRFAWDYEMPTERPKADRLRVELWSTRDAGVTWQRAAVDDDVASPINVTLPTAGLYGFRLEIVPDIPGAGGGPRPGDAPESWIGIDEEPPFVELISAARVQQGEGGEILIRYTSRDQLAAPRTARLLYSPGHEGPWATIATDLENQGEYRWQPDRATPARVHVRVEVSDAAGNVGSATSAEPVIVTASRVVGRLGGLRSLPSTP
jgi:hypothetical protein